MSIFICGNSHTRALRAGAALLGEDRNQGMVVFPLGTADNEAQEFSRVTDGRVVLTNDRFRAKLWKNFGVRDFDPNHRWGICLGTHNARIYRQEAWLRSAPAWLGLPGLAPVSETIFAKLVENDQTHIRAFLDQLLATGVRPFVISAPWPVRTHPIMTETGVNPQIVKAIDARARELFVDWLNTRDIPFVAAPEATADEDGFLKARFAKGGDDPYHGNGKFGRIMIEKVIKEQLLEQAA